MADVAIHHERQDNTVTDGVFTTGDRTRDNTVADGGIHHGRQDRRQHCGRRGYSPQETGPETALWQTGVFTTGDRTGDSIAAEGGIHPGRQD